MSINLLVNIVLQNIIQLSIIFIVGYCFLLFFGLRKINSFFDIFSRFIVGIVTIVFITAVYKTNGKTIMSLSVIPLFVFIKTYKKDLFLNSNQDSSEVNKYKLITFILPILLFSLLVSIGALYKYEIRGDYFALPHPDYIFYGKVSTYIWETGVESSIMNYFYPNENPVKVYHYFELWLNAVFSEGFKVNKVKYLITTTYPVISTIVFIGFLSLYEISVLKIKKRKNVKLIIFLSFLSIFSSGIYFNFFNKIPFLNESKLFSNYLFDYYKLSIIYVFLFIILIGFTKEQKNYTYILAGSLFLGIIYSPVLPATFLGYALFTLIRIIRDKKLLNKSFILEQSLLIITAILIFVFYLNLKDSNNSLNESFAVLKFLKTSINIIIGGSIMVFVIFSFYIVIIFNYKKVFKKDYEDFIFVGCIFLSGIVCWAGVHTSANAVQLFSNITIPILIIFLTLKISEIITKYNNSNKVSIILLVLWGILISKNINELLNDRVSIKVNEKESLIIDKLIGLKPNGVFLKHKDDYITYFDKIDNFSILAWYLIYINPKFHPVSLSVFDIPITHAMDENAVRKSIFYKYVKNKKEKKEFSTIEQAQIDFIKENKIEYLITTTQVQLNAQLNELVKEKIVDEKEKLVFYILK